MFSNLFLATTLLLSLVNTTVAERNVWSKSVDAVGASMQLNSEATQTPGFAATFYSYPWGDFIPFWDDSWVQGSYSYNTVRATANAVTSPNFSFRGGNKNLYGLYNINVENVVVELKGYYSRTYIINFFNSTFAVLFIIWLLTSPTWKITLNCYSNR